MDKETIIAALLKLRGDKSQQEVADLMGISKSTYCRMEQGSHIKLEHIFSLAKAYGVNAEYILALMSGRTDVIVTPDIKERMEKLQDTICDQKDEIIKLQSQLLAARRGEDW